MSINVTFGLSVAGEKNEKHKVFFLVQTLTGKIVEGLFRVM